MNWLSMWPTQGLGALTWINEIGGAGTVTSAFSLGKPPSCGETYASPSITIVLSFNVASRRSRCEASWAVNLKLDELA